MSLSSVDHDGAKMYFDYEANTISFNSKDYHVGVRVKRISAKEGFRAIIPRYFTYENPYIIGHNDPPQEMYGTIKGTIRATGAVSVCDWVASFSDNPVTIGPSIRDTRIVYGRVTEDRGDKALLLVNYTAPASNTARTVYIYDTSDVRPNNYNTIERFPERWISYYNSYGARDIDPWMGVRKGYTCEEPERKPLLTRKEEYAYEDGEYRLVSSVDYEYETERGSSVLVDYRATQVMFKQQAGNVDYSDIYHFPIYAHSRMGSNPIKEMRVGYHESGNDTTIVSTKYHTRSSLDVPVRVQQKSMTDKSRTTFVNYTYADHMLSSSWADELNDSHYLSVPITVSKQTPQRHPIQMNSLQLPVVLPVTNIKEEVVEYDWITINGNRILLPSAHIEKTGGVESWRETVLSRDGLGNISSFKEKGQPETVVLWGYKGQLPVAVIRNSSFEEVKALFSSTSVMDSFALSTKPMSEYNRILSTLRTELPSAHVTTYTYIPGVGISTITDEAGMVTTYEYDHAGRLVCVKDNDGNKVSEYTYSLMSDSDGRKHIRSKTYRSDDGTKYTEDVSWWDVFGRKTEDIAIAASTSGKDLVTAYGSDFLLHDDVKTWLPYPVANSGGAFQTDAEQAAAQYHGNDKAYTFNKYELSNRDRVVSTAVAGYAGVHETSFLKDIAIDFPILEWKEDGIVERGVYDSCDIVIDKVVDADGRISSTFRNQLGQTLATSKASDTPTYYIYDELEQLRAVVNSGISLTDTLSMWRYDYDSLGRLKSKGIPNSAREFYTYDQEDRLVSVLRNGALKEMEYDAMGRVVKVYHSSNEATRALWEEHTYDTYPQGVSGADPKGLVTKSQIAKIAPNGAVSGYTTTTYVYDAKKRPTLVRTRYSDGSRLTTETQYTFAGETQSVRSLYEHNAGADELVVEYTYDVRGRLTKETATLCVSGSAPQVAEVSYGYDALGRLAHKLSSVPDGKMLHETIEFALQGWQTGLSVSLDGRLLFSQTLGYDAQESMSSYQPQYSGLISIKDESWFPMSGPAVNDSKWYTYDYAGRLSTEHSPNSRTTYSYDVRGNLLEVRDYNPYSKSSYTYLKDRLLSMTISSPDNQAMYGFTYDVLGRMLYDGMTGQFVTYNDLDLVGKITKNGITLVNYDYLADGVKLSALDSDGEGLVYRGPFVYRKGSGNSSLTLESAAFSGGRMTPNGAMLYVTDYLGSVRAVVDGTSGELYKVSDFSAFGAESRVESMQNATTQLGMTFRDSYTGKEDQHQDFSTHYTDFGARQYNPVIRRWMTPDPLSEKYYGTSPYAFSNNNPVNFVDLDGREIHVASEYQEQFIDDLKEIFGDKVESFSFDGEKLTLNVTKKEFKKGLNRDQKALFKGLDKALSDRIETSVIYENSVNIEENGKVQNIDVIRDYGGGAYIKDKGIIVVAPDIGTVTVWPDDHSSPVEIVQNTTSGLFHEIGERNRSQETYRGSVIIYENHARRILGLHNRPYDLNHSNTIPTVYQ